MYEKNSDDIRLSKLKFYFYVIVAMFIVTVVYSIYSRYIDFNVTASSNPTIYEPIDSVSKTIFDQVESSPNKTIKYKLANVIMIRDGVYDAYLLLNDSTDSNGGINSSVIRVYTNENTLNQGTVNLSFHLTTGTPSYTSSGDGFIEISDTDNFTTIDSFSNIKIHNFDTRIYIPQGFMNSIPYDRGKSGVDINSKLY